MGDDRRNALFLLAVLVVLVIFVLIIRSQRKAAVSEIDEEECTPVVCDSCPTDIPVSVACEDLFMSNPPYNFNFDLKPFVLPNMPEVDWTTLTIDNTEVATQHFFLSSTQAYCTGDPFPLPEDAPFGTHIFRPSPIPFDLCGPGTQTSPTSYTWEGCDGIGSGGPGPVDGEVYTANWSYAGDGVLNFVVTTTWLIVPFTMVWRITYSFQDVNGCSYTQIAYYSTHLPL
jgi:hypothetical protein